MRRGSPPSGAGRVDRLPDTRGTALPVGQRHGRLQLDATGANLNWSTVVAGSVATGPGTSRSTRGATVVAFTGTPGRPTSRPPPNAFQPSTTPAAAPTTSSRARRGDRTDTPRDAARWLRRGRRRLRNVAVDPQGNVTWRVTPPHATSRRHRRLRPDAERWPRRFVAKLDATLSTCSGRPTSAAAVTTGRSPRRRSPGSDHGRSATESPDYPMTAGAYGIADGNMGLTRLVGRRLALRYSTVIGRQLARACSDLAVDAQSPNLVTIVGETNGADMPTTQGAFQPAANCRQRGLRLPAARSDAARPTDADQHRAEPRADLPATTITLTGTNLRAVHGITVGGHGTREHPAGVRYTGRLHAADRRRHERTTRP